MLEVQPNITSIENEQEAKNTGLLTSRREFQNKNIYDRFYNKFATEDNKYLNDQKWAEAAVRGDLDQLVYNLQQSQNNNEYLDNLSKYEGRIDYDTYMLALAIPQLNDTEKKSRVSSDGTTVFGDYTDKEWAELVLNSTENKWKAELVEEEKATKSWIEKTGAQIGAWLGTGLSHVFGTFQYIYNLGEGLFYAVTEGDFLKAYANDETDPFAAAADWLGYNAYMLEYTSTDAVNAEKAYEEGFIPVDDYGTLDNAILTEMRKTGYGQGYTDWGRYCNMIVSTIGDMLPYMLIPGSGTASKVLKTGGFYAANVFGGNISETVKDAKMNGISYTELDQGEVIANAATKAAAQYAVEVVLGKIIGFTGLDKLMGIGDDVVKASVAGVTKVAKATGMKAVGYALGRGALDMFKEGLEEVCQDLSDQLIDGVFGGRYAERAKDDFSLQNLLDSFIVGALTSGVTSIAQTLPTLINRSAKITDIDGDTIKTKGGRDVVIDEDGKARELGFFEQLNYNKAMQAMASWQNIISDNKASEEAKKEASFKFNMLTMTVGNILKTFGNERSKKALEILSQYQLDNTVEAEKEKAKLKLSDVEYAQALYTDFAKSQVMAQGKYQQDKLEQKLKKAIEKSGTKLKNDNVTQITDIVTKDTIVAEGSEGIDQIKQFAKEVGATTVVGTNGQTIIKSSDVIFAPNGLIKTGNTSAILKGITYEAAVDTVANNLTETEKNLILQEYQNLSGSVGTINDAVTALLFDQSFYTYVLLKANEVMTMNNANAAIKMLTTIDKLVKGKIAGNVEKGTLTQKAYQKLIEKIQKNMQAGLLVYATTQTNIDLDSISPEVLPSGLKDLVRNNKNVIITEAINDITSDKNDSPISQERIDKFNAIIDKYNNLNAETNDLIIDAKKKITSSKYNDRFDAVATLRYIMLMSKDNQLIYLKPANPNKTTTNDSIYLNQVTEFFGVNWQRLINGPIELTNLSKVAQNYINKSGYKLKNENDRIAMLRERLQTYSNGTLTISKDGEVLETLDKNTLVKKRYLTTDGNYNLHEDVKSGKIKYFKDICKIKVNEAIGNLRIIVDPEINFGGYFDENNPTILHIGKTGTINEVMHEATHATQYFTRSQQSKTIVAGASMKVLSSIPDPILDSIDDYMYKHFPLVYLAMTSDLNNTIPDVIYFNIEGEIQASAKLTNVLFESGFTWSKDRKKLISPDGKKSWNLTLKKVSTEQRSESSHIYYNEVTIDSNLNPYLIKDDKSTIDYINNNKMYKGLPVRLDINEKYDNTKSEKRLRVDGAIWLTDNINLAETYTGNLRADDKIGDVVEMSIHIKNPLVIDGQNRKFSQAVPNLTTNQIAQYAKDKGYDSVIFKNVQDVGPKLTESSDGKRALQPSTVIAVFSNDNISNKRSLIYQDYSQISESRVFTNNTEALQSNMKYYVEKGKRILTDRRIKNFVVNTTADFDKLEPVVQKAIKNKMNLQDIKYYAATAKTMNDYTYQAIAKYIYENEQAAKLTFNQMLKILDNLEQIDVLHLFVKDSKLDSKEMTPEEMLKKYKQIETKSETNPEVAEKLALYTNLASTIKPEGARRFVQYTADPDQLHSDFMRLYDGTVRSVSSLNNYGKNIAHNQEALTLSENEGKNANLKARQGGVWNWIDRMRKADIVYKGSEVFDEINDSLDRQDKINIIQEHIIKSITEEAKATGMDQAAVLSKFYDEMDKLNTLNDDDINKLYTAAVSEGTVAQTPDYLGFRLEIEKRYTRKGLEYTGKYASRATAKATAKRTLSRLGQKLAGMKTRYNKLSENLQKFFDRKSDGQYIVNNRYKSISDTKLDDMIIEAQKANTEMAARVRLTEAAKAAKLKAIQRANRQAEKMLDSKADTKKTMREKIDVQHRVVMKQEEFNFVSKDEASNRIEKALATGWDKSRTTTVQGLDNNIDQNIANAKTFYNDNTQLLNMSTAEAEADAKWFIDAKLTGTMTSQDIKKFEAIQMYYLGYILSEAKAGGQFENLNANIKQQIENFLRDRATSAGTALSVWNNIRQKLNPLDIMMSQSIEINGIPLLKEEQDSLIEATNKGDFEEVAKIREKIFQRINQQNKGKRNILRKITTIRSMSMLSSPLTWIRNVVSNFMLKRLNKWSAKIGQSVFKSKSKIGQLSFKGNITPEIQTFINNNFINNKMFDSVISNLSKYNPSEINRKFKNADGTINKDAILANMVIKSIYGEYYNKNMFNTKFMNQVYSGLMKMMSDNSYVREAAVRYLGKILAEKRYDLSKGITDAIMTDFANAIGIAMSDYMHSDNFLTNFENVVAERGEVALFAYKNIIPFMATTWNWFKAAIKFSPIGLAQSIVKFARLENTIRKQESLWASGKSQVSPEYTEYLVRRDLGSGVIGTSTFLLGILLSSLGFMGLSDDDYGTPKLTIGNIKVDVSSIFGTSSLLAGAAFIEDIKKSGLNGTTFLSGLNNMLDVTLDGFFLTELMSLDLYSNGSFSTAMDLFQSTLLSFIPNGLAYLAGATYTGKLKKNGLFGKTAAKIPFLAGLVNEKKVDPYTGDTGSVWDIFNRIFPYFDVNMTNRAKSTAESLGLNKKELKGQYTINDEQFNLNAKQSAEINKAYGEWNAKDLTDFLDNKKGYKVKDSKTGKYKTLKYSQMTTNEQRTVIERIMSNNAENAKILAWLNAGNAYYTSNEKYMELKSLGITGKLYKGTKGFVKK